MEKAKKGKKLRMEMMVNKLMTFILILIYDTYEKDTVLSQCSYHQVGQIIHMESDFGQRQGNSVGQQWVLIILHRSRVQHWS